MRAIAALALAVAVTGPAACRSPTGPDTAPEPALPRAQVVEVPADCSLGDGAPPEAEGFGLGLLDSLRGGGGDTALRATTALLAGSLANSAGDWERAYAFCALVPASATPAQRVEAAVCQNKAAVGMGPARTACADLLAAEWISDPARVGLGFGAPAGPVTPEEAVEAD